MKCNPSFVALIFSRGAGRLGLKTIFINSQSADRYLSSMKSPITAEAHRFQPSAQVLPSHMTDQHQICTSEKQETGNVWLFLFVFNVLLSAITKVKYQFLLKNMN